LVKLENIRWFC